MIGRRQRVWHAVAAVLVSLGLAAGIGIAPGTAAEDEKAKGGEVSPESAKAVAEKRETKSAARAEDAGAQKLAKGPHDALPVAEQIAQLEKLRLSDAPGIPRGVDPDVWKAMVPQDNQPTAARVALGKKLYFETRLSKDGTRRLRHLPRRQPELHRSATGLRGHRRPARAAQRADHHERALLPDPVPGRARAEPGGAGEAADPEPDRDGPAERRRRPSPASPGDAEYQRMFQAAYGRPINYDDMARAIASFERTLIFLDAPFDDFVAGDTGAVSAKAAEGWVALQRQGALRELPRAQSLEPARHRRPLPQHRRLGAEAGLRGARRQGAEGAAREGRQGRPRGRRPPRARDRPLRARPLPGHQGPHRHRRVQDLPAAQHRRSPGRTCTTARCRRSGTSWITTTRAARPTRSSTAASSRWRSPSPRSTRWSRSCRRSPTSGFAAEQRTETARQRAVAAKQRPFRETALAMRKVLPFESRVMPAAAKPAGFQSGKEGKQ